MKNLCQLYLAITCFMFFERIVCSNTPKKSTKNARVKKYPRSYDPDKSLQETLIVSKYTINNPENEAKTKNKLDLENVRRISKDMKRSNKQNVIFSNDFRKHQMQDVEIENASNSEEILEENIKFNDENPSEIPKTEIEEILDIEKDFPSINQTFRPDGHMYGDDLDDIKRKIKGKGKMIEENADDKEKYEIATKKAAKGISIGESNSNENELFSVNRTFGNYFTIQSDNRKYLENLEKLELENLENLSLSKNEPDLRVTGKSERESSIEEKKENYYKMISNNVENYLKKTDQTERRKVTITPKCVNKENISSPNKYPNKETTLNVNNSVYELKPSEQSDLPPNIENHRNNNEYRNKLKGVAPFRQQKSPMSATGKGYRKKDNFKLANEAKPLQNLKDAELLESQSKPNILPKHGSTRHQWINTTTNKRHDEGNNVQSTTHLSPSNNIPARDPYNGPIKDRTRNNQKNNINSPAKPKSQWIPRTNNKNAADKIN